MRLLFVLALGACAPASSDSPVAASAPAIDPPLQTKGDLPSGGSAKERAWDLAGAEQDYAVALAADPASTDTRVNLARVQMLQGKVDVAEATLRAQAGERAEIMNALSTIARMQKRFQQSVDLAKRVLLRDPQNVQAHVNIAMAYLDWAKLDVAELYAQGVLVRMPKAGALNVVLGLVHTKRGQAGLAMAQFKRALEIEPNNPAAHVNAAFLALAFRDYQLALTHLDAAVQLGAVTKEVTAGRCYAFEGLRQGEPAAQCLTDLASRSGLSDSERAGYFYTLGSVHQTLTRKPKAALDAYRKYVELKGAGLPKTDKVFQVMKKLEATEEPGKPQAPSPASQAPVVPLVRPV